jgi:hypothetical protein
MVSYERVRSTPEPELLEIQSPSAQKSALAKQGGKHGKHT